MKDFEKEIINEFLSAGKIETIDFSKQTHEQTIEYSGTGYFLTLKYSAFPGNLMVLDNIDICGQLGGTAVGYMAFIEDHKIILECYSYDHEISDLNRERGFERSIS